MGRQPCCEKVGLKKGPWTPEEDRKLITFLLSNAQCCWRAVPKLAGLLRCGKSCRLRWTNYLRPDLKRGLLSEYEEQIVINLHAQFGNRWSKIASHLPGRTDNEIKTHWNTHIKKKLKKMGIDPLTHKPLNSSGRQTPMYPQPTQRLQQEQNLVLKPWHPETVATERKFDEEAAHKSGRWTTTATGLMDKPMSMGIGDGIIIDKVPLIEPYEILVHHPATASSSASSAPSSSSTVSLSSDSPKVIQDLKVRDFGEFGRESHSSFHSSSWNDEVKRIWDFLISDDASEESNFESYHVHCPREGVDEDPWTRIL